MPRVPQNMPKMSMTMEFGTVEQWLIEVGGAVKDGDAIVVVTTDKVDMDVESTTDGTLVEILAQPGGTIVAPKIDKVDGTPRADEAGLLRAVYNVLSADGRPSREIIADVARRRFGRPQTMGLLRNVVDGSTRRPGSAVAPAELDLPPDWTRKLATLATQGQDDALAWCWNVAEHDRLTEHDGDFEIQVRRWLSVPPLRQELVPCR
jgi:hypothetical protein